MEKNQLPSLKGLAQGKRRRRSSDQAQNDKPATSLLEDALPRIPNPYVSSFLPSEYELLPWTMNYSDLLESEIDDCISEALPHAKKWTPPSVPQHSQMSAKTLLENQAFVKSSFHPRILADRVQNSIQNLRLFYERLCNIVGLEGLSCSDSEGFHQAKKQREITQLPKDHNAKFGDTVSHLQVCNQDRQLGKLDGVSSENHTSAVRGVALGKSSNEGSWHWMSQITQKRLTETLIAESRVSRTEGGESKYTEGKRSASTDDLKDLLFSLQSLLSVLKNREEAEKTSQAKMQALREKKEALRIEKQLYKDKYKQQNVAECLSSVSQESVGSEWLNEIKSVETFSGSATFSHSEV